MTLWDASRYFCLADVFDELYWLRPDGDELAWWLAFTRHLWIEWPLSGSREGRDE